MNFFVRILAVLLFAASFLVIDAVREERAACATGQPMTKTCNTQIMSAIENRAWVSAQREITQNQNLIAKPDSVLEYTCFDQFLNVLAQEASNMFSENETPWRGSVALVTNRDMDNALSSLVAAPVTAFANYNFNHSYLGGRGPQSRTMSPAISGGSYTCEEMNKVWEAAKCANFAVESNDGFMTYQQHSQQDARKFPTPCQNDQRWSSNLQGAFTNPQWKPESTQAMTQSYNQYRDHTAPGQCNTTTAIRTGVTYLHPVSLDEKEERVCVNPGCSPNGNGGCQ